MQLKMSRVRVLTIVAAVLLSVPVTALAATYTVNSTNDVDDGTCDSTHCSLREAIKAANASPGIDTIKFNIPGTGPKTVRPNQTLPTITDTVSIDGYTQPGAASANSTNPVLMIELDGSRVGSPVSGLKITGEASTIRGLVINRFNGSGIDISGVGGNFIEGNFIGTDVTGTVAQGNTIHGVSVAAPNDDLD